LGTGDAGYAIREKTKRLTALLAPGFAPHTGITIADATLLKSAVLTNGVVLAVLQQRIAGMAGTQGKLDRVPKLLTLNAASAETFCLSSAFGRSGGGGGKMPPTRSKWAKSSTPSTRATSNYWMA
jgi:hypothetical protein